MRVPDMDTLVDYTLSSGAPDGGSPREGAGPTTIEWVPAVVEGTSIELNLRGQTSDPGSNPTPPGSNPTSPGSGLTSQVSVGCSLIDDGSFRLSPDTVEAIIRAMGVDVHLGLMSVNRVARSEYVTDDVFVMVLRQSMPESGDPWARWRLR